MDMIRECFSEIINQAEGGDALAACQLGDIYRQGESLPQDWGQAFYWYSRAAESGYPAAQNNLGTMFLEGLGCDQDLPVAVSWYRKAAEQGLVDAQWNLAKRYLHGMGTAQDFTEAYRWFEQAAAQNYPEALCEMGTMHRFGQGRKRNLLAAANFHIIAARKGDSVAIGNLSEYRSELEDIALSGNQMASVFLCQMNNQGLGVDRSQPLTWSWILWAMTYCGQSSDTEIAEETRSAYSFYRQTISDENRLAGEIALQELCAAYLARSGENSGPATEM